jgi:hypothetical protein
MAYATWRVMKDTAKDILSILDGCADRVTFPMLDNGYVYLAASRLSLFRSAEDWAMTIEIFGVSPRAGVPDTHIYTFGSSLDHRNAPENFVNRDAYENYLRNNPNNESRFVFPVDEGDWIDGETVSKKASIIAVRRQTLPLPSRDEYQVHGIDLESDTEIHVFELCRYLAAIERRELLATPEELRTNVPAESNMILQLDEWNHPDVADDSNRPSGSETFQQLADVLVTGNINRYQPTLAPNTHWRNWPDGGTL